MIDIRLLGEFNLIIDEVSISSVKSSRVRNLLAYLLLHSTVKHTRSHIAFTFWADKTEVQAYNNLRQAIHQIRQTLPNSERYIYSDASTIYWRRDSDFRLDVNEFEAAIDAAILAESAGDYAAQETGLEKALSLYRGELLPSYYDEWVIPERERLHNKYVDALEGMVRLLENQRQYSKAIPYAKQILQYDQLNEIRYRTLIRLFALSGERANALHVYHSCVDILQRELGEEPEAATKEMYHRLLRHQGLSSSPPPTPELIAAPPLVGREAEWQQLIEAWQRVSKDGTRFILLEGEAGIGKSRLAEELLSWVAHQGFSTAQTRSYAAEGRLAYGPIADWLRREAVRPNLKNLAKVWQSEIARLLPELLVELPGFPKPEPLKDGWQRLSFYQAITQAFLSVPQPLLLFIDDLQWCDPETLEWIHYFLRSEPAAQVLVVGTVRIEEWMANQALQAFLFTLRNEGRMIEISLNPLDAAESARLAAHVSGHELEIPIALQLFKESEGNPLFVLELLRSGFLHKIYEAGLSVNLHQDLTEALDKESNLPPKVLTILLARLAALSPSARQLAGLAATVGRAFSFDVLVQASGSGELDLLRWLDELWQCRIVRVLDENTYDFSHDKLREVAYRQASLPHRRALHRRVAYTLKTVYASDLDPISGQLAVHFDKAGLPVEAIHHYYQGALTEQRVNANQQAIKLLERALTLLRTLPEGQDRNALELDLQTALGVSKTDTLGHGSAEVIRVNDRALALCQLLGRPPSPPILRAKATDHIARAEFKQALEYSEQLINLAELQEDGPLKVEANYSMGVTKFWLGAFPSARDYLEKAISLYDPQDSHLHISLYSQNPKVICQSRLAFTLWCLGYPSQAVETSQFALDYAAAITHPWSLAYATFWNVLLLIHNQAIDLASQRLTILARLCDDYQIQHFMLECTILQGWFQAEQGEMEIGIAKIQDGMEHFHAGGAEFQRPFLLSLLAELLGRQGNVEQGLVLLREAQELVEKNDERWCHSEILRRRGELLLRQSNPVGAEEAYLQAMQVACSQEAKMLELRAACALGLMWLGQGRASQANEMITPLYQWFTDGLDTPDLQNARILLANSESNSGNSP